PGTPAPPPRGSTLPLHDALPISRRGGRPPRRPRTAQGAPDVVNTSRARSRAAAPPVLIALALLLWTLLPAQAAQAHAALTGTDPDRKSTRLNSSHVKISYAVFCL